jgi:hypothetical protein
MLNWCSDYIHILLFVLCLLKFSERKACRSTCDENVGKSISMHCRRAKFGDLQTQVISHPLSRNRKANKTCDFLNGKNYYFAMQGSGHQATNASVVINDYLSPDITTLKEWFRDCPEKLLLTYTGATVSSEYLEELYPHQRREKVRAFNDHVRTWLAANHPAVVFLDPYNITFSAIYPSVGVSRSSDGFHLISDFNILYANVLLNLMHIFATTVQHN